MSQELKALTELQRQMAIALRHGSSLTRDAAWTEFARLHVSGNERLDPVEQLEIYREQFWLRHTSALVEDFPGVGGILGQEDWEKLAELYLREVAPDSYTLRNLGSRLPQVIEQAPWLPHQALCFDMARLELAYIEAFDAEDTGFLAPQRLASIPEEDLEAARLVVAPCVQLLEVSYPVADLRRALREPSDDDVPIPEALAQRGYLVVYRRELKLWDMPVSRVAHAFLAALVAGGTLGAAAERAATSPEAEAELAAQLGAWLEEWTTKGLLTDVRR